MEEDLIVGKDAAKLVKRLCLLGELWVPAPECVLFRGEPAAYLRLLPCERDIADYAVAEVDGFLSGVSGPGRWDRRQVYRLRRFVKKRIAKDVVMDAREKGPPGSQPLLGCVMYELHPYEVPPVPKWASEVDGVEIEFR
ncbi:MAG: hypothetical protein JNL50_04505 [Phycisphaerae bacterium]|nr:hypothetical protein [Phycisphaerae bacterium]